MTYSDENRNADRYNLRGIDKRDEFDEEQELIQTQFGRRHSSQLEKAVAAEGVDGEWIEDKNKVIELNRDIRVRRKNFDTYKNAIEVEKNTLQSRTPYNNITWLYECRSYRGVFIRLVNVKLVCRNTISINDMFSSTHAGSNNFTHFSRT
ncbi:MAG: hypothetical protein Ct9H90mP28_1260 [Paracoccaceae bacterium]|nr:MAG: hypothetical protein Ct9H90mP28_1260 [Paracoccaceae bacterium]